MMDILKRKQRGRERDRVSSGGGVSEVNKRWTGIWRGIRRGRFREAEAEITNQMIWLKYAGF